MQPIIINLPHRTDRLAHILPECEKIGIKDPIVWKAINGQDLTDIDPAVFQEPLNRINRFTIGCYALRQTTLAILKHAIEKGYESILLIEDDARFADGAKELMEKAMAQLPDNWEYLNFGGYHFEPPTKYSENLVKVNGIWHAHCIAIHSRAFEECYAAIEDAFRPADLTCGLDLVAKGTYYAMNPNVAFQITNHSDITGEEVVTTIPLNPFDCEPIEPIEKAIIRDPNIDLKYLADYLDNKIQ